MEPSAIPELELYTNCILCAACFGACPVDGKNPEYLGPAALAKLYRFSIDPREARETERLKTGRYTQMDGGHVSSLEIVLRYVPKVFLQQLQLLKPGKN